MPLLIYLNASWLMCFVGFNRGKVKTTCWTHSSWQHILYCWTREVIRDTFRKLSGSIFNARLANTERNVLRHSFSSYCLVKWEKEVKILQWRYEKENFLVVCHMMDHHILLFAANIGSHEHAFRTILGLFRWQVLSITVEHCSAPNFRQCLTGLREIFHQ